MGFLDQWSNNIGTAATGIPVNGTVPGTGAVDPNLTNYGGATPYPNFSTPPINAPTQGQGSIVGTNASKLEPKTLTSAGGSAGGLKYNVEQWTYPVRVSGDADLQHYVVFFINVRGASKWKDNFGPKTAISKVGLANQGLVNVGVAGAGATIAVAGLGLAGLFGGEAAGAGVSVAIGALEKGIAGAAAAKIGVNVNDAVKGFVPDQSFRVSQAIMLAVNEKPSVTYGVEYDGKDLGTLVGFVNSANSLGDLFNRGNGLNADLARTAVMAASKIPSGIADALGFNLDLADALKVGTASTPNPFREQVFRNVDTREFVFNYKFLPRSQQETQHVQNIIQQFKFHMHPELSDSGLFYIYPSTFDISYFFKGSRNQNIHKISTCVLEKMSVDYGSGSGYNTFPDGSPTEIDIRLQFREIEVLTKAKIKQGY